MRLPDARRGRLLFACLLLAATPGRAADATRPGMDVGRLLGEGDQAGFARALEPRAFVFPQDHGAHEDFRNEWWYVTAHLEDEAGARYGVQFTLFRQALAPPTPAGAGAGADESAWRTRQVWMAHVALTAPEAGHEAAERFSRGALGLAGVRASPFAAWLEDWRLESAGEDDLFPLRLRARVPDAETPFEIDLRLEARKGPVAQGDQGLSRKSAREGNASYYYSFTRLEASGRIRSAERSRPVRGLAWLDREWSTSALDPGQTGWDWLALHLDDGRDLMLYRIRRSDGQIDGASAGTLVDQDGSARALTQDDWLFRPEAWWTDENGARWPVVWRLTVPSAGIDGRVEALIEDQLDRLSVRYWEGMVCLRGEASGCGFLELTGYGAGAVTRAGEGRIPDEASSAP
ncbi:MAG: lipocalin-like domain-containing protein [Pseudomonadales bacterium]|nr:lipocalin-like domain-containing protein [Pseudomonadales bacterium]